MAARGSAHLARQAPDTRARALAVSTGGRRDRACRPRGRRADADLLLATPAALQIASRRAARRARSRADRRAASAHGQPEASLGRVEDLVGYPAAQRRAQDRACLAAASLERRPAATPRTPSARGRAAASGPPASRPWWRCRSWPVGHRADSVSTSTSSMRSTMSVAVDSRHGAESDLDQRGQDPSSVGVLGGVELGAVGRVEHRHVGARSGSRGSSAELPPGGAGRPRRTLAAAAQPARRRPRRCAARARAGSAVELREHDVGRVALIAGERLIAAVAVERDRDVLAGHLRQVEAGDRRRGRRTARRSGGRSVGRISTASGSHDVLVMLGARTRCGDEPGLRQLVVRSSLEADRERLDRLGGRLGHRRDDGRGVDAAREERAEGDVGDHPPLHGAADLHRGSRSCSSSRVADGRLARVVEAPVALGARIAVLVGPGASPAAACAPPRRRDARRGHAAVGEVGVERAGSTSAGSARILACSAASSDAKLSALRPIAVEQRLLADAVTRQEQQAPASLSHSANANMPCSVATQRRPMLLVEVDDHLGVALGAQTGGRAARSSRAARGSCRSRR